MAALGFILFAAGSRMSSLNSSSFSHSLASESEQPSSESFTDSKLQHIISEELPFTYFIDTTPNQCLILF